MMFLEGAFIKKLIDDRGDVYKSLMDFKFQCVLPQSG